MKARLDEIEKQIESLKLAQKDFVELQNKMRLEQEKTSDQLDKIYTAMMGNDITGEKGFISDMKEVRIFLTHFKFSKWLIVVFGGFVLGVITFVNELKGLLQKLGL